MKNIQKVLDQNITLSKLMNTSKHFKYCIHSLILDYDKRKET